MAARPLVLRSCFGLLLFASLLVSPAWAQLPKIDKTAAEKTVAPGLVDADLATPRATMRTFLRSFRSGSEEDAAKCLDLPSTAVAKRALYSYHLKGLIDRMVRIDYAQLPNNADHDSPVKLSELASHLGGEDLEDAQKIVLDRHADGRWLFTRQTVGALHSLWRRWRERLELEGVESANQPFSEWLEEQFPDKMREAHFLLPDYQWVCLLLIILVGFIADLVTRFVLSRLTAAWFRFVQGDVQAKAKRKLWKPVGLLAQALVWFAGTSLLDLPDLAMTVLLVGLKMFAVVAGIWTGFLLINLFAIFLAKKAESTDSKFDDLLVPLVSKSLKVFVVCVGLLTCAQAFNLPITGLLGGLGLGGMALALASKDAVSNLFGSITVLIDRPFEVGDWIITDGVEGTVETVGFRSTRIRTFYNSQITVPNSLLTTAKVDNMGRRRYRRIKTMIGLQYDTTPQQLDAFCEGVRELIRRHPYTRKDYYHVYFNQFSGSSLDVLLYCFIECPDWSVELRERHRLFLDIMRLTDSLGVSFAFPTRTLHMFNEESSAASPEIDDAVLSGRHSAASIAGPLLPPEQRPAGVPFEGPSDLGDNADG
jgi:MscS family membrane protein